MNNKKILFCGLPASGKTTFLGAFAYSLESNEIETALKYNGTPNNRTYLNQLADSWLNCEQMERTLLESREHIELNLKYDNDQFLLTIPDLSGETWSQLWSERQCKKHVKQLAQDVEGVMFFIHSDTIQKPISVMEINKQQQIVGDSAPVDAKAKQWRPNEHAATQTIVIDLLQTIAELSSQSPAKKLAIVMSAWDTTQDLDFTPEAFVEINMPLLFQYIKNNFDYAETSIYGISAQGGDLSTKAAELVELDDPSRRVKIVDHQDLKHDLSIPIKRLLQ